MNDKMYQTIIFEQAAGVARITLNRPEVHNAFNAVMIGELTEAFDNLTRKDGVRVVVLTGKGRSFCAGADLNWMREIIHYTFEQNLEESRQVAELLQNIYLSPKPTVAVVNGTAIGGGTGLLSACDIALAAEEARFGLSEVKIGLVPAAISPFVVRRIGESRAREYFLTGKRISAHRAREIGLVNEVVPLSGLAAAADEVLKLLLTSGPEAVTNCKELLTRIPGMDPGEVKEYTARMIAELRVSDEGQEGMAAFFEKRKPSWIKE